jgi:ATP-binding cassette subfamily B protein
MPAHSATFLKTPFRYYFKQHKRRVALGLLALLITNAFETTIPFLLGKTIDKITHAAPFADVLKTVALILCFTLILSTTRYLWRIFWGSFHHRVAEDLRNRLFDKYTELSASFFRERKVGQLISLIAHDVNSFRMGIGPGMLVLFDGIFYASLIIPVMISISLTWTLKTLVLMPFVPFVVRRLLGRVHAAYHSRQDRFSEMSGSAQEIISGIRVVKSFAQEENQTRLFNRHSEKFQASCNRVALWDCFIPVVLELPVAVGSVALLLVGAPEVMSGAVSLGSFFAFYQYIQRMVWPMEAIGNAIGQIQEGRASFSRIKKVLETEPDVVDNGQIELTSFESLEVRDLTFCYPGKTVPALANVSFRLVKGQTLGIVGETGSGKTTLIELLSRQYPVPSGKILVNGHSLEQISLRSLRRVMGVVPQEAFLFSRRVCENLAFSQDEWTPEDVTDAAEAVRLHQEILTWPEKYESMVGERGVNLSGGQKQRMTLARALMKEAELVILDDSLSAVDARTEQKILSKLKEQSTAIIISHRLAAVSFAENILVLKNGRVEAFGSHDEVMKNSAVYHQLHEIQKSAVLP